ncbi:caspase family protein [Nostoc sp. GT001]|uniref:caspase family protein n=1 Tax=Nostoc sp. GT001 TaxID=3056647 RepID=UPI0025AAB34C|nr:caspase family protein [Nostoc sp. GT001]MDM9580422.1 caspase family protein [Nostoc sp. GT001]
MSHFKRRQFLQFATSALTTLGLNQLDIKNPSLRYAQAIASSSPRKLALLVGINNYQNVDNLKGAITDTYLQRELLIHRFGFNPQDILIVSDESEIKPTRQGILQAFEEHLIKQAKPGDIVVYHFSGHGSQVFDRESALEDKLNSTFVPSDRTTSLADNQKQVSDITGKTLFLLMSQIKTENLTVVLDSCYSGGGKRGNLTIRSIEGGKGYISSDIEREYQQKLLFDLGISPEELEQRRKQGIAKGVVIASARKNQVASEAYLDNFVTGAFTYLMTQYLWQENSNTPLENVITNISRSINSTFTSNQIPELEAKNNSNNETKPTYFISRSVPTAEAVITQVRGNNVNLWLGGIAPQALAAFNQNPIFELVDNQGVKRGRIQLQSRKGLTGEGKILELQKPELLKPGALLQEGVRVIPSNYKLRIGLDDSLGKDIAVARNEIAEIERLQPVVLQTGEVHYIFGRITEVQQTELRNKQATYIPPLHSLGLYTEGLDLIPGSFGNAKETINDALTRLKPKFRSLLAARIIKLTLNANSSRLNVLASLNILRPKELDVTVAAQTFTSRSPSKIDQNSFTPATNTNINYQNGIPQIPLKTQIQFQVKNQENSDLYITVLAINPEGKIDVIFPNTWSSAEDATLVKAGETLAIPKAQDTWVLGIIEPLGLTEILVVASKSPLRKSLQSLQTIAQKQGRGDVPVTLADNPTNIIDLLLEDIDSSTLPENRSRNNSNSSEITSRQKALLSDTTQLAAMSITYQAVK